MGKITEENRRALENATNYDDATLTGMISGEFTTALARLIEKKQVPVLHIVENTHISKSYINKLRNPSEKSVHPGRYVIIDICLAINATLDETNYLLKMAQYQELYTRNTAEALIIWGMLKGLTGKEIRDMIQLKGLDNIFKEG